MTDLFQNDGTQTNENVDYLAELVGEGKKFRDPQALAKGKAEADRHISTLTQELAELREFTMKQREEAAARATLEELIDQTRSSNNTSSREQPPVTNEDRTQKPQIDPNEYRKIAREEFQAMENSKIQQSNADLVRNKLKELHGNNYQQFLAEQTESLGLTQDFVNNLARTSPTAFFRTLGVDANQTRETFQTPPRSSQGSDNFQPSTKKRTWSYYQQMKKDQPKVYSDPKTQAQMLKDATDLGDSFTDGDYHAFG